MGLLLLQGSAALNPRELFANGEQGLWLDPSDMTAGKAAWRRNLLTYSEQFDNAAWTKQSSSITANATTAPNGESTADKLIASAGTAVHYASQNVSVTSGVTYTFSVYAKKADIDFCALTAFINGSAFTVQHFNLNTGQKGTLEVVNTPADTFVSSSISSVGSGWYRVTLTVTAGSSGGMTFICYAQNADNQRLWNGDGTSGIFIWGAQLELGSTPTEYQPITDFSTEFKAAFPTHTLYQDSNGVTPCTAAGDPVGLIIDQSRGGLGAKTQYTLTNGSFDSALTGWSASNATTDTSTSGQVSVTSTSGAAYGFIQATGANVIVTSASAWYEIVVDCELVSGTGFIGAYTTSGVYSLFTDTGRKTRKIIVQGSNVEARVGVTNSIGTSIIVYDIKVYQVPGNHAYQTTSASRPTLARIPSSGRRNVLVRSEDFGDSSWLAFGGLTKTGTASVTNPIGTTAGVYEIAAGSTGGAVGSAGALYQNLSSTYPSGDYTFSVYVKAKTGTSSVRLSIYNGATNDGTSDIAINDSTWTRITYTRNATLGALSNAAIRNNNAGNAGSFYIWGAQLETGSTATNYQKVVATTDVTESGVSDLWHLVFDGSDDSLTTNSVDMTGTAQMTVIAGVRKLSDAAIGIVAEHGNTVDTLLAAPRNVSPDYGADLRHSGLSSTTGIQTYTAPISNVVSVLFDRSAATIGGQVQVRANGTLPAQNNTGTGPIASSNFTNNVIFIGRRNSATLPFNGHLYQLIVRGRTTPTGKLLEAERFVAKRTGVTGI